MDIQLCVFDMAGTTVKDDDAVARTLLEVVAERGVAPPYSKICSVMGLAKPTALRVLLSHSERPAPTDHEISSAHADFEDRMIEHYLTQADFGPIDGTLEAFARLRARGCRIALDTGFSRRIVNAILLRLDWYEGETIDVTVASDEVPRGRPFPDMIERAMNRVGVRDSDRVAKIGDTVADMREGAAARCGLVIGVLSGTGSREALRAERPSRVVDTVADVPDLVVGLGRGVTVRSAIADRV